MDDSPSGKASERSGWGPATTHPLGNVTGIPLARLQVPHGGARKNGSIPNKGFDLLGWSGRPPKRVLHF